MMIHNITYMNVNNGSKSAILNLIELKFVRMNPSMKYHILLYSNDLDIYGMVFQTQQLFIITRLMGSIVQFVL